MAAPKEPERGTSAAPDPLQNGAPTISPASLLPHRRYLSRQLPASELASTLSLSDGCPHRLIVRASRKCR